MLYLAPGQSPASKIRSESDEVREGLDALLGAGAHYQRIVLAKFGKGRLTVAANNDKETLRVTGNLTKKGTG